MFSAGRHLPIQRTNIVIFPDYAKKRRKKLQRSVTNPLH